MPTVRYELLAPVYKKAGGGGFLGGENVTTLRIRESREEKEVNISTKGKKQGKKGN